ncbi:hypothetical protein D3C72_1098070 [compost metagenome]
MVERRAALAVQAIDADAEAPLVAEAAADVDGRASLRARAVVERQSRQIARQRAFRHGIDDAAHAAIRRHPVQQGGRPLEHLDALQVFRKQMVIGRDAIHAVERHFTQIALVEGKTADEKRIRDAADLAREAGRRIAAQHLGQSQRLLVQHALARVAVDAERRIEQVFFPQHASTRTLGNLPAGIRFGLAGDDHGG